MAPTTPSLHPARHAATIPLLFALAGCAGAVGSAANLTAPPVNSPGSTVTTATAPADDTEIRALITEALTPQLCPRLIGSFIGLPGEGTARGPAAGNLASAGRWWIRRCTARVENGRLHLALGGDGWTWVDRETSGFRVRQYMLFESDADLSADVSVGYDRTRRIASLWMTPAAGVTARVTPRGVVSAEATGIFSAMVGAVLPVTGASASDRARQQVEEIGSAQMRERLGAGFTMTMALDSHQVDFMVGALSRGEMPERPYPSDTTSPWLVNQRSTVMPGGIDVVGPIDVTTVAQGLDVALEEGDGASIRAVCAEPLGRYLDTRLRAPTATVTPPQGPPVIDLAVAGGSRHAVIPVGACPTLLVIMPRANATLPVRLRYRVAPEGSAPASSTGGASAVAQGPAMPQPLTRVRIQILGVTVSSQNSAGHDWDVVGGDADVYVVTASVPLRRQIDRTPTVQDHNAAQWGRWLPGVYDATRDFPLRFSVYDEDSTSDELIGTADFDATALPTAAGEMALAVRTTAAVPTQVGTLRLRLEAAPQ